MATAPMNAAAMPAADDEAADPMADAAGDDAGGDEQVLVTITKSANGYCVYAGASPDDESAMAGEGESEDDADATGDGSDDQGAAVAPEGPAKKEVTSIGEALKASLDILNEAQSSEGAEGSSDDQFSAGFDEGSPAPAMAQKY